MNKAELIEAVAARTSTTKKQANAMLDAILGTIVDTVADGERSLMPRIQYNRLFS